MREAEANGEVLELKLSCAMLCSRKSKEVRVTEGSKQLRVIEEAIDGRLGQTVKNL